MPEPERVESPREVAWLIEQRPCRTDGYTRYLVDREGSGTRWSMSPNEAMRFVCRGDAASYCAAHLSGHSGISVAEHVWIGGMPSVQPEPERRCECGPLHVAFHGRHDPRCPVVTGQPVDAPDPEPFDIEAYIGRMVWSSDATDYLRTVVIGNVRALYGTLRPMLRPPEPERRGAGAAIDAVDMNEVVDPGDYLEIAGCAVPWRRCSPGLRDHVAGLNAELRRLRAELARATGDREALAERALESVRAALGAWDRAEVSDIEMAMMLRAALRAAAGGA